jgi:hypothetical protein
MHECKSCCCSLGQLEEGDVVACLRCGQWHEYLDSAVWAADAYIAKMRAREMPEGFDNYKLLEAFDQAEQAMGPESDYVFRSKLSRFTGLDGVRA